MATSGEGQATAAASGAGGKFRRMPFRRARQATPYDRPPSSTRGTNNRNGESNNSSGLFTKLVVDPASKLINYGAQRFFASVFRKRLPPAPPQPAQPPEINSELIDDPQMVVSKSQSAAQMFEGGDFVQTLNHSSIDVISELEHLLKQKTFSRSEINHLTELLQSRAVDSSFGVDNKRFEKTASGFGSHQPHAHGRLQENINEGDRSHGVISTPIIKPTVVEDDMASPAELAKAYMGSRPSKVSPSMLGSRSVAGASENGFITPTSRGRSAIYNMGRTPYSRSHPHSIHKGIGLTNNGYGGQLVSSHRSLVEQSEISDSRSMALKRRNSVLDDDLGSVGPVRRIRQKPNLLAYRIPVTAKGMESGSDSILVSSKQKLPSTVKPNNSVSNTIGVNRDDSIPSTSYTHVPSKSSEVAARILQHLEKLTPKEKSPESKLVSLREKSPVRVTSSMLNGKALKSMEDASSLQLLLEFEDGQKVEDNSTAILPDARDSTFQKLGKAEQISTEKAVMHSYLLNPVVKNDFIESSIAPRPSSGTFHSAVKNGVTQPHLKKRAFMDDGIDSSGIGLKQVVQGKEPTDSSLVDNYVSVAGEQMLVNATIQQKTMIPSAHISNKTTESGTLGVHVIGEGNGGTVLFPPSAAIQSGIYAHSVDTFGKLKEDKDLTLSSGLSSKASFKSSPFPSESSNKMPEPKSENSSSLVNVLPFATGTQSATPESDQGGSRHPLRAGDVNGKSHIVPFTALNGPLVLRSPAMSSAGISSDANQVTASSSLFNPSISIANFVSTGNRTSTSADRDNPFGSNVVTNFGSFLNPSATEPAPLATNDSESVDLKTKAEKEPSFGYSSGMNSSVDPFADGNSGNSTSGRGTSANYSTAHSLQGSSFVGSNKFLVSGVEAVLRGEPIPSVSSAVSVPSSNMSSSILVDTPLSNSQFSQHQSVGFSSLASLSDTVTVVSSSEPAPCVFKFGGSSIATSIPVTVSSFSTGPSGIFKFDAGSLAPSSASNFLNSNTATSSIFGSTIPSTGSSSDSVAVVSNSEPTASVFKLGGSSDASSIPNTVSSFSTGASGIFKFVASSSSASSAGYFSSSNTTPSNISSSTFPSTGSSDSGAVVSNSEPAPSVFKFGGSSVGTSLPGTVSSFSSDASGVFKFGASTSTPSSASNFLSSNTTSSNIFSTTSPSTGFSFGALSADFVPTNVVGTNSTTVFNSTTAPSAGHVFSFAAASPAMPSQSPSVAQPIFGDRPSFASSPGNGDQMNTEDSMVEDPVQSSAPSLPVFSQPAFSPSPSGFAFGSSSASPANPFQFSSQQNQVTSQNPSLFQGSGGSFSLGSGGGDKPARKFIKVSRTKNRKK